MSKARREEKKLRTYLKNKLRNYPQFFVSDIDYYAGKIIVWSTEPLQSVELQVIFPYRIEGENSDYIFYYNDEKIKIWQLARNLIKEIK